ncbi:hypothetical protein XELAEV_18015529mg [Xenopus laevis]|uniref:Uncharacterized protein n=1 Tax=Xenopus laevis TaxID=8355 RepID=A0A974DI56_XENLA|nr:hypothetical protein XELAEV_18015529mg [Xenopus laevis]
MASLLQDILYEVQGQSPAPNKDFHHLLLFLPREVKKTHSEFLEDNCFQQQVQRIFSKETMEYVLSTCKGNCDFIVRLPNASDTIHLLLAL